MAAEKKTVSSENIVNDKWDQTIANFMVKTGVGLGIGIVSSALLFKRRMWPVTFFTGAGAGTAYADAQRIFDSARTLGVPASDKSKE